MRRSAMFYGLSVTARHERGSPHPLLGWKHVLVNGLAFKLAALGLTVAACTLLVGENASATPKRSSLCGRLGCVAYHPYYVVLTSGTEKQIVVSKGKTLAEKLGATLVLDDTSAADCSKDEQCLLLIDSDHADIGAADGAASPIAYAVVYAVHNGFGDANRQATLLLAKARHLVKDAYKKRLTLYACE